MPPQAVSIMAPKRCCGICGLAIRNIHHNPGEKNSWAEECRAIYTVGYEFHAPRISGIGVPDTVDHLFVPRDPSKRYDDRRNNDALPPEFRDERLFVV